MPLWSMSGFVTTMWARARMALRASCGRVAVVGEGADVGAQRLDQAVQLGELVLGQGLGREQVQGARVRVLEDRVQDGQVVAERLARRGGSDHDRVASGARRVVGLALVRVRTLDPAAQEHVAQAGIEVVRKVGVPRLLRGKAAERGQHGLGPEGALDLERLEHGKESALGILAAQDQLLAHVLLPTGTPYPARRGTGCVERSCDRGVTAGVQRRFAPVL